MRVFFVGAKAQARLNYNILRRQGHSAPVVFDRDAGLAPPWDCELVSNPDDFERAARTCEGFAVCIGGDRGRDRVEYSERLQALGLVPVPVVHAAAQVGENVEIGKGVQMMTRAVVSDFASVGDYCLLNTNCSVDHDCRLGRGVHIMGAAALAGAVTIGEFSTIGTNATVLPNIVIGRNVYVGAGAVVTRNVPDDVVIAGVPARVLRQR